MTSWDVFLSDSNIFRQEIFSLDKFWFCRSTQNAFKPLVWHFLHKNIFNINDFMKVYEKLIIFIKPPIFNIFWWKKCLTRGLKVFWVDLRNQNLSRLNISCIKIFWVRQKISGSHKTCSLFRLNQILPWSLITCENWKKKSCTEIDCRYLNSN